MKGRKENKNKIHAREEERKKLLQKAKKKSYKLKAPHPSPHHFTNGPSLIRHVLGKYDVIVWYVKLTNQLHLLGRPVVIGETEQYTALSTRSIVLFSIVLQ